MKLHYVGPPGLHDGTVIEVQTYSSFCDVTVKSYEGRAIRLHFSGVKEVNSRDSRGMMIFGLLEEPLGERNRFTFANWDENSLSSLEVIAETFTVFE